MVLTDTGNTLQKHCMGHKTMVLETLKEAEVSKDEKGLLCVHRVGPDPALLYPSKAAVVLLHLNGFIETKHDNLQYL